MTLTLPPHTTAMTAMDAMTHAVEASTSLAANRPQRAIGAIRDLCDGLHQRCRLPRTLQETGKVAYAQLEAIAELSIDDGAPRQREILADMAGGKSNMAIARDRQLTQRAVEKHVSEIFGRLGLGCDETISPRVHATLLLLSQGAPT